MKVGTRLTFVEEHQSLLWSNIQSPGELHTDAPYAVAHDNLLNDGRFHGITILILFH